MQSRPLLIVSVAVLLLSGCVKNEPDAKTAASPSSTVEVSAGPSDSATAAAASDLGELRGRVVDEESLPVKGVDVAIQDLNASAKTDANGSFAFTKVPTGRHTVAAAGIGYTSQVKSVDVTAGAPTWLNLTLQKLAVVEAYATTNVWHGYMSCGIALVPVCGIFDELNQDFGTPNPTNEHWLFNWSYPDGVAPVQTILELVWAPTAPGTCKQLTILGVDGFGDEATGSSPVRMVLNNTFKSSVQKDPKTKFQVGIYPELVDPVVGQKFELYRSDFFGEAAPEGWSVLAKGG